MRRRRSTHAPSERASVARGHDTREDAHVCDVNARLRSDAPLRERARGRTRHTGCWTEPIDAHAVPRCAHFGVFVQYPRSLASLTALVSTFLVTASALADDAPAPLPPPSPPPPGEVAAPETATPPPAAGTPTEAATPPPPAPPVAAQPPQRVERGVRTAPPAPASQRATAAPARDWLQIGVRAGVKAPYGAVWRGPQGLETMGDHFALQAPVMLELSGRVTKNLYIGAYGELALGATPGVSSADCERAGSACQTASVRAGVQLQHHFSPGARVDPWLGAAIGYEIAASQGIAAGRWTTTAVGGWEVLRAMGGVDFRVNRGFAIGPYLDVSASTYEMLERRTSAGASYDDWIGRDAQRAHGWVVFGIRGVLFP